MIEKAWILPNDWRLRLEAAENDIKNGNFRDFETIDEVITFLVEAKPLNDKELKYLIELQSEIPEQMKSETVDRLLNTIAALKASNARLIKAIEPLLPDIRFYMDITDKNLDDEEQITLTVRELAELAAAAKEGADGNTKS